MKYKELKKQNKTHRSCIIIDNLTIEQFEGLVNYLDALDIGLEYARRVRQ